MKRDVGGNTFDDKKRNRRPCTEKEQENFKAFVKEQLQKEDHLTLILMPSSELFLVTLPIKHVNVFIFSPELI